MIITYIRVELHQLSWATFNCSVKLAAIRAIQGENERVQRCSTGVMKEHSSAEVILHDIDPTAVDLLIEYAYTGEITITPDNVQVLLPGSSLLQIQEVREACCRFLMKQLHPTNCLGIRSFAGNMKKKSGINLEGILYLDLVFL